MSNKYTYSVPFTEEQLVNDYYELGMTQTEIAKKHGVSQKVIWRAMSKMGLTARKAAVREQEGENNANWKGGRILVNYKTQNGHRFLSDRSENKGYWMVKNSDHPNSGKNGYVFEHIVIALNHCGRESLEKDECVHHIDFNRQNNDPLNLVICKKSKHREYHGRLENLIGQLLDEGIVTFDKELGYVRKGE